MAAVTITAKSARINIAGSRKQRNWIVSGNSGDTLATRFRRIDAIHFNDTTITLAAPSGAVGALVITFTTGGGAFSNVEITVIGV